jgi:hypothetical protein
MDSTNHGTCWEGSPPLEYRLRACRAWFNKRKRAVPLLTAVSAGVCCLFWRLATDGLVWLLLYAHRHQSILGAAGHIRPTPANQLMEEYNSEPPEQSCLLRWKEKIASL